MRKQANLHQQAGGALEHAGKQLQQAPTQMEFARNLGVGAGSGLATGMTVGAPLGALIGMGRGNTAEGLGRGLLRGGATGLGLGAGGAIGRELGAAIDPKYRGLGGLLGATAGAGLGYIGSGAMLGDPEAERRKREVAHGEKTAQWETGDSATVPIHEAAKRWREEASRRYQESLNSSYEEKQEALVRQLQANSSPADMLGGLSPIHLGKLVSLASTGVGGVLGGIHGYMHGDTAAGIARGASRGLTTGLGATGGALVGSLVSPTPLGLALGALAGGGLTYGAEELLADQEEQPLTHGARRQGQR